MKLFSLLTISFGLLPSAPINAQPASLGRPVSAASLGAPSAAVEPASGRPIIRGSSPDPLVGDYSPPARLGPISEVRLGPSIGSPALDTPEERYNWGVPDYLAPRANKSTSSRQSDKFGEKFGEYFNNGGHTWNHFESDHCFDDFISPTSNPFLAEDPRSLTEIRPIFMFQTIPNKQYLYKGGNIEYFGLQGRLAVTERFSLVLHKLGGLVVNPGTDSGMSNATGFAEIWLGPKYTWYRDEQSGTIAAGGVQLQFATGRSSVYQDTGTMSFVPYVNVAQKFGKTSWGTFAVMDTLGYSVASSSLRSSYFYNSIHLDFDVANWGRIYPFVEMNWFHYTKNGSARTLSFEGVDLANVGSTTSARNLMTIAIGSRFKITEAVQFGVSAELPVVGTRDLFGFRLGVDLIWRY